MSESDTSRSRRRAAPARKAAAAKAGSTKTDAKAAAARANGKKGGRPKAHFKELLARMGPPPDDPLHVPGWFARLLAQVSIELAEGRGSATLASELRAQAGAINRLIPVERIARAEAIILAARSPAKPRQVRGGPPKESYVEGKPTKPRRGRSVRR